MSSRSTRRAPVPDKSYSTPDCSPESWKRWLRRGMRRAKGAWKGSSPVAEIIPRYTLPMTDRERKQLQGLLKEGKDRLRESVASVRPEDGYHRPTPDRWSVVEIVEHVILAEDAMFHMAAIA